MHRSGLQRNDRFTEQAAPLCAGYTWSCQPLSCLRSYAPGVKNLCLFFDMSAAANGTECERRPGSASGRKRGESGSVTLDRVAATALRHILRAR